MQVPSGLTNTGAVPRSTISPFLSSGKDSGDEIRSVSCWGLTACLGLIPTNPPRDLEVSSPSSRQETEQLDLVTLSCAGPSSCAIPAGSPCHLAQAPQRVPSALTRCSSTRRASRARSGCCKISVSAWPMSDEGLFSFTSVPISVKPEDSTEVQYLRGSTATLAISSQQLSKRAGHWWVCSQSLAS